MKKSIFAVLVAAITMTACGNDGKSGDTETVTLGEGDHEHVYSCPMHPDVRGKKGDKCPKCGMALEHTDGAETSNAEYFMQFNRGAAVSAEAGKPVTLTFVPKIKGRETEEVPLDVEHEKKIHLIAVSEDLSWFDHIHPEYGTDGSYTVTETFPAGGKYYLFADYKPTGGGHKVDKIELTVSGAPAPAKTFNVEKLSGTSGAYTFTLQAGGGKFVAGAVMHMAGILKKGDQEMDVATLENYLGAKAHIMAVSAVDKNYLHIHPDVNDGRFHLHTTFEKPGIYRWWVQFMADGKVHTIDLTTNVIQGTDADRKAANEGHAEISGESGGGAHDHSAR